LLSPTPTFSHQFLSFRPALSSLRIYSLVCRIDFSRMSQT
jgi:hypothetical protein